MKMDEEAFISELFCHAYAQIQMYIHQAHRVEDLKVVGHLVVPLGNFIFDQTDLRYTYGHFHIYRAVSL